MLQFPAADTNGTEYVKLDELAGLKEIRIDGGFDCRPAGKVNVYRRPDGRHYFMCSDGNHFLDGQADDGVHCIGCYKPWH